MHGVLYVVSFLSIHVGKVRVALLAVSADIPASRTIGCYVSWAGARGCNTCERVVKSVSNGFDKNDRQKYKTEYSQHAERSVPCDGKCFVLEPLRI